MRSDFEIGTKHTVRTWQIHGQRVSSTTDADWYVYRKPYERKVDSPSGNHTPRRRPNLLFHTGGWMGIGDHGMATCTAVTKRAEDSQPVPCFTPAAGWELEAAGYDG